MNTDLPCGWWLFEHEYRIFLGTRILTLSLQKIFVSFEKFVFKNNIRVLRVIRLIPFISEDELTQWSGGKICVYLCLSVGDKNNHPCGRNTVIFFMILFVILSLFRCNSLIYRNIID